MGWKRKYLLYVRPDRAELVRAARAYRDAADEDYGTPCRQETATPEESL